MVCGFIYQRFVVDNPAVGRSFRHLKCRWAFGCFCYICAKIWFMEDTFRHKGLRKKLVETVAHKGITDKAVLEAIGNVPRHLFMDSGFIQFAYRDQAFPIGAGQTISQPYTVAFQSQLLQVNKHE
jgi:hypothetical protein